MEKLKDKYYEPTLNEFYVGFEFEMHDTWSSWKKMILTEELLKNPMVSLGSGNERAPYYWKTRVKKLDFDDIIDLGWELDQCVKGDCFFYHKNYSIMTEFEPWLCFTENKNLNVSICDTGNSKLKKSLYAFNGHVHNKSVLKQVMDLLKIVSVNK